MYKWILNCMVYKKTISVIIALLLVFSFLGIRHLQFDYRMSVSKNPNFESILFVTVYDKHLIDPAHLQQLAKLQQQLAQLKSVKKVVSLYTMPNIRKYIDDNTWNTLCENKPYATNDIAVLKKDLISNPLLVGKFVSKNADTMMFYLYMPNDLLGKGDMQHREEIQKILDQYHGSFEKIFQAGYSEVSYHLIKEASHDLSISIPCIFLLMALLFGWLFRNIFLFILPLFSSLFGIFCALGMMGWLGIPASPLFIASVVITLAIGVAESAHIIYAYQNNLKAHPEATYREHCAHILKKVLLPFSLAAFSAMLGFVFDILSFVRIIQDIAYGFALCIFFNTSASILLSPLILKYLKVRALPDRKVFVILSEKLVVANLYLIRHAKLFSIALLSVTLIGVFIFKYITIESLPYSFFKKDDKMMSNVYFAYQKVSGLNTIQVEVSSKEVGAFLKPDYLQKVLDSEKELRNLPETSYTYSVASIMAQTHKMFLYGFNEYYKIPQNDEILKMYYRALWQQGDISSLMNQDLNQLTIYVNYRIYQSALLNPYKQNIKNILEKNFKNMPLHFNILDSQVENERIVKNLLMLQIYSIFSIYLISFIIVGWLFRSAMAGILSVIPNIFPICVISIMQYTFNIPISYISVILYSIVIGLSMDETIHIFYAYREQYRVLQNKSQAIEAALRSQVTPVTITSFAIAIAWLVLVDTQLLPLIYLGVLCGVGVFAAWFSDLIITPFLLQKIDITKKLKLT